MLVQKSREYYKAHLTTSSVRKFAEEEFLLSRFSSDKYIALENEGHISKVTSLKFLPSNIGRVPLLISADSFGEVRIWQCDITKQFSKLPPIKISAHEKSINCLSTCSSIFATGSDDRHIKLWTIERIERPIHDFIGHSSFITCVDFSTSAPILASSSVDKSIRLWHQDVEGAVFTFQTEWPIYSVQFVPNEVNMLLTAGDGGIHLWDVRSHKSYLEKIGGSTTESIWKDTPKRFNSINDASGSPLKKRPKRSIESDNFWGSSWSKSSVVSDEDECDEPILKYECSNYDKKEFYNSFTKTYDKAFTSHKKEAKIFSAMFSHDGQYILSSASDNRHKVWSFLGRKGLWTFKKLQTDFSKHSVAPSLSPDDKILLCGSSDGKLRLWSTFHGESRVGGTGEKTKSLAAFSNPVCSCCFSDDGTLIASGDVSGRIRTYFA